MGASAILKYHHFHVFAYSVRLKLASCEFLFDVASFGSWSVRKTVRWGSRANLSGVLGLGMFGRRAPGVCHASS